jgi:hypothetical protein
MGTGFVALGCGGKVVLDTGAGGAGVGSVGATVSGTGGTTVSGTATGTGATTVSGTTTGTGAGGGGAESMALLETTFDPSGPCAFNQQNNPPGALFFVVSNVPISCAHDLPDAFATAQCGGKPFVWEVCVAVPPSSIAAGSVDLSSPEVNAEEADAGGCKKNCCGSGGIFNEGTLTFDAVETSSVTFTFSGVDIMSQWGTVGLDGTYTAQRCP